MFTNIDRVQVKLGAKLISDSYPYYRGDRDLWMRLVTKASSKSIGLYASLTFLRAAGAKLERNDKFGYVVKPILRSEAKWGWPSDKEWNESKKVLTPYTRVLMVLLKEMGDEDKRQDELNAFAERRL